MSNKDLHKRFSGRKIKDYGDLKKYFEVEKWLSGLSSKIMNRRKYLSVLEDFIKFTDKNPKELIDDEEWDRKKDRRKQIAPSKKRIKDFYEYCIKEMGNTPNTAKWKSFSVIAGFYSRNNFPLKFHQEETPAIAPPKNEKVFKLNGKMESDLKKVLKLILHNLKTLRDKAITSMMASSGMDMADLFKLKYKDIKGWLDAEDFVIYEYVREKVKNKTKYPAVTVFTLESLEYLKAYMNQEYPKPISDEDFIFISLGNEKNRKKRLSQSRFSNEIKKVCESIDIRNVTPKSFRRFCFTKLEDSGIHKFYKDLWMGHSSEISDAYDLWSKYPEKIREIYAQAIPYVTIGDGYVKLNSQIEQLEKENKELKEQMQEIKEEMEKIKQNLKEQISDIQAQLKNH